MIPRIDFGHFYRFLVSAGLFVIAAGLALPWLVLREVAAGSPTEDELTALPDSASRLIEARTQHLAVAAVAYPWVSIAAVAIGLTMAIYGFVRWRKRQQIVDQLEDVKLAQEQITYRKANAEERSAKADEESAQLKEEEEQEAEHSIADDGEEGPVDSPPPGPSDPATEQGEVNTAHGDYRPGLGLPSHPNSSLTSAQVRRVEQQVLRGLRFAMATDFEFDEDVRVESALGTVIVDAVARPTGPRFPLLHIEVKFSRVGFARSRLASAFMSLSRSLGGRPKGVGLLVCIFDDHSGRDVERERQRIGQAAWEDAALLRARVTAVVFGLNEFFVSSPEQVRERIQESLYYLDLPSTPF